MKRLFFTVTTDLNFDQRMQRICTSLSSAGFEVTLVGREKGKSKALSEQNFNQHRIKCRFESGKLFYLEYNWRLYKYLKEQEMDALCSCDLDTILPGFFLRKRWKWVYDAHEYFSEMEEVVQRPWIRRIWKAVERLCVPRVDLAYTVSKGYAELFEKQYPTPFHIIRNIARLQDLKPELRNPKRILYQGSVNHGRGLEELIEAMYLVEGELVICGEGDLYEPLKSLVHSRQLEQKVTFTGYLRPEELLKVTQSASIGITLFSKAGLSNEYSLGNRFFDYLQAGIPQLAMNYPEYQNFNRQHEVAVLIDDLNPRTIAPSLNQLLKNESEYQRLESNALEARMHFNWQEEERKLSELYLDLFKA